MTIVVAGMPINLDVEEAWKQTAADVKNGIEAAFKKEAGPTMESAIRQHVSNRYPGSNHWNPQKINADPNDTAVDVDVAGAVRNYWDVDIYPRNAEWLTIPTQAALDMGVRSTSDVGALKTFRPKGKNIIATVMDGSLVGLFALSKHVHQNQDPTLLPTDETLCGAICAAIMNE